MLSQLLSWKSTVSRVRCHVYISLHVNRNASIHCRLYRLVESIASNQEFVAACWPLWGSWGSEVSSAVQGGAISPTCSDRRAARRIWGQITSIQGQCWSAAPTSQ